MLPNDVIFVCMQVMKHPSSTVISVSIDVLFSIGIDGGEKSHMQGRKLPEPGKNKSSEDFIAHQRALSRQTPSVTERPSATCEDNPVPNK